MFDEEDVKSTYEHLPRLIRIIFFSLGITNEDYLRRYRDYYRYMFPDKGRKELAQKSTADRKVLQDKTKLTFSMMHGIMTAMGYEIDSVTVVIREKMTGETKVFSTSDTVEMLKQNIENDNVIGVQSLV